ncbi:hypothetical protein FSARC_2112 [Fusarium sarcochroum]|uniref:Azaphilone pigments biosynthesis cluster protein L N-terminal domain-containing protein n=1 Tax=Fusarium sarcochroum TaxID=1208366 RepID=A0A8H4U7M9_9HYPO|nr:hypothetical protein FSARC_2112 [Fusarium sarcochroum]
MEAVGASASVLTFLTVAFSVTKSIHDALSAIKDGPQVIRYLNDEVAQLESILQRLSQASFASIDAADKSELEGLAKKCKDDLTDFESKLRLPDVSGADGRRDKLWRKLKLCFTEKDIDQMRHVVRGHIQLLTIRLNLVQIQQGSFTATQSTEILSLLQQLRGDVAALKITDTPAHTFQADSAHTTSRVTEVDDTETVPSPDVALDGSIARLMRLLEKKPCVVESDEAEELVDDLEQLLQSVQQNVAIAGPMPGMEKIFQLENQNVSKELKLITNMVLSAPSMKINQNGKTFFFYSKRLCPLTRAGPVGSLKAIAQSARISQDRKRNTLEMSDGVVTIATTKRRRKLVSRSRDDTDSGEYGREFLASLTFKSRSMKKMLTLSVHQGQMLFDSFTSILPRITVCNVMPEDSPVFQIASSGSVEDLMKLISEGKASIHDHDTNGWSLLHEQMLRRVINISPFVYPDSKTSENQDLISLVCETCVFWLDTPVLHTIQEVEYLLKQGYCINSTDEKGLTVLHAIFKDTHYHQEGLLYKRDLLTYLVCQGADVYATDNFDLSVSHYAYGSKCEACFYYNSSSLGDVWDAVLDRCGYDILDFRKLWPRDARYVNGYTRKDFERLWRGREHCCPYWDDMPWPTSEQDIAPHDAFFARGQLCFRCFCCQSNPEYSCFYCGVCLSEYEYYCVEGTDHQHNDECPRSRVAIWVKNPERGSRYYELEWTDSKSYVRTSSSGETDSGDDEQFSDDEESSDKEEADSDVLPGSEISSRNESESDRNRVVGGNNEAYRHDPEGILPDNYAGHASREARCSPPREAVGFKVAQGEHDRSFFQPQGELYENAWEEDHHPSPTNLRGRLWCL